MLTGSNTADLWKVLETLEMPQAISGRDGLKKCQGLIFSLMLLVPHCTADPTPARVNALLATQTKPAATETQSSKIAEWKYNTHCFFKVFSTLILSEAQ